MAEATGNLDVIRQGLEAWSRGDLEGALAIIHPEIEWVTSGVFLGSGGTYHGHEGVRRQWQEIREAWETISLEPKEMLELDDRRALTVMHFHGRGRASGIEADLVVAAIWTARDRLLVRYQGFPDKKAALSASRVED